MPANFTAGDFDGLCFSFRTAAARCALVDQSLFTVCTRALGLAILVFNLDGRSLKFACESHLDRFVVTATQLGLCIGPAHAEDVALAEGFIAIVVDFYFSLPAIMVKPQKLP